MKQRGMVTFELAVGILSVTLMAAFFSWVISLAVLQAQCNDTAAAVVQSLARGDDKTAQIALAGGPQGAQCETEVSSNVIKVTIKAQSSWAGLPPITVVAKSAALRVPDE